MKVVLRADSMLCHEQEVLKAAPRLPPQVFHLLTSRFSRSARSRRYVGKSGWPSRNRIFIWLYFFGHRFDILDWEGREGRGQRGGLLAGGYTQPAHSVTLGCGLSYYRSVPRLLAAPPAGWRGYGLLVK